MRCILSKHFWNKERTLKSLFRAVPWRLTKFPSCQIHQYNNYLRSTNSESQKYLGARNSLIHLEKDQLTWKISLYCFQMRLKGSYPLDWTARMICPWMFIIPRPPIPGICSRARSTLETYYFVQLHSPVPLNEQRHDVHLSSVIRIEP